jgi:prevent-host-death family protein
MKTISLSELRNKPRKYLKEASREQIVVAQYRKPAGVLIGFKSEEEGFEFRLMNDPRFLKRIEQARASIRTGCDILREVVKKGTADYKAKHRRKPRRGKGARS